jgi:hypothetical protein
MINISLTLFAGFQLPLCLFFAGVRPRFPTLLHSGKTVAQQYFCIFITMDSIQTMNKHVSDKEPTYQLSIY